MPSNSMNSSISHPSEIQDRLRKRFIERLSGRIKKMRKDLASRDWEALRLECHQIKESGKNFGFDDLALLAANANQLIPSSGLNRGETIPEAKEAITQLISKIDQILTTHHLDKY